MSCSVTPLLGLGWQGPMSKSEYSDSLAGPMSSLLGAGNSIHRYRMCDLSILWLWLCLLQFVWLRVSPCFSVLFFFDGSSFGFSFGCGTITQVWALGHQATCFPFPVSAGPCALPELCSTVNFIQGPSYPLPWIIFIGLCTTSLAWVYILDPTYIQILSGSIDCLQNFHLYQLPLVQLLLLFIQTVVRMSKDDRNGCSNVAVIFRLGPKS
jgi:hypothetical protein